MQFERLNKQANTKDYTLTTLTVSRAPILSYLILFWTGLDSITLWAQWPEWPASPTEESWGPAGTHSLIWNEPSLILTSCPSAPARGCWVLPLRVCVVPGYSCNGKLVCECVAEITNQVEGKGSFWDCDSYCFLHINNVQATFCFSGFLACLPHTLRA